MARKKPTNMERVAALLSDSGFVPAGVTQSSGRPRFRYPESTLRVTVGKQVTTIYKTAGAGVSADHQSIRSSDLPAIEKAIGAAVAESTVTAQDSADADVSEAMFA